MTPRINEMSFFYLYNCSKKLRCMDLSLRHAIELLAAFQALLFAAYLLSSKTTRSKSTVYIAIFLILSGLNTANYFVTYFIEPISSNLSTFINTSFFLMPASLFLYTRSTLKPLYKLNITDLIHLAPLFILNLILIPYVYLENLKENPTETELHFQLQIAAYIIFYVLIFVYQVLSFRLLKNNKQLYYENYSNTDIRKYQYLRNLNIIFTVLFLISAIKNIIVFNLEGPEVIYATNLVRLSLLIFFCWIIFKGLQSPELFQEDEEVLPPVKDLLSQENEKSVSTKKSETEINLPYENNELLSKVKQQMKNNEPYLDPSLSIHELARQTRIPTRELSILINHTLNKHFFDFVNEYRIDKAKQLLVDPDKKALTVLEILYDVGFNSKSSFNTAFKKHTGFTPTKYRRNNLKSVA